MEADLGFAQDAVNDLVEERDALKQEVEDYGQWYEQTEWDHVEEIEEEDDDVGRTWTGMQCSLPRRGRGGVIPKSL